MLDKRREITGEANLPDDRVHLAADPRDLRTARLVHLVRGQVQRGEHPHTMAIVIAAVGQLGGADRAPAGRRIFVPQESQKPSIAGNNMAGDRRASGLRQPRALGLRHPRRKVPQRPEQQAALRIVNDVGRDRLLVAFQHHRRQNQPLLDARPHQLDVLIRVPAKIHQPRYVVVVVPGRVQGQVSSQLGKRDVEAGLIRDRHQVRLGTGLGDGVLEQASEDVVVCPIGAAQPRSVNLLPAGQKPAPGRQSPPLVRQRFTRQLIVPAMVSQARGEYR
jgi:hypothetical protein